MCFLTEAIILNLKFITGFYWQVAGITAAWTASIITVL